MMRRRRRVRGSGASVASPNLRVLPFARCRCLLSALATLLIVGAASGCAPSGPVTSRESDEAQVRRLFAILDYIGTDYAATVADGRVVNESEYAEQIGFVTSAREILADLREPPADLVRDVRRVEDACLSKVSGERVAELTRVARRTAVESYGLVQSPATPPSYEKGAQLFAADCAPCHGASGVPPADKLRELKPPPRTLSDRDVLATLSPHRVFNAVTLGVSGTAMPTFDTVLPAADRWSVAFYVFTLRAGANADPQDLPETVPNSLPALAAAKDSELRRQLSETLDSQRTERALDALRIVAPYREVAGRAPLLVARTLVEESETLLRSGRNGEAGAKLLDAYFSGFELVEGTLRTADSNLVMDVEAEFQRLRRAAADGDVSAATESGSQIQRLLSRAESLLDEGATRDIWFGASAGALIIFREGAEAALLVLLLLAGVAGTDRRDATRAIHAGWISALVVGALTFVAARVLTARLAVSSEIIEAVATLSAAAILFFVSHWLLGQIQAARWSRFIKERVRLHLSQGRLLALAGLAFLAVFREAVETVLFFEGLLASGPSPVHVLVGAIVGTALLGVAMLALRRLGSKLPLRAFFTTSSVLLYSLCVVFAGNGAYALVAAGLLPPRPVSIRSLPALGIHSDANSIAAQALLLLAVLVSVAAQRYRAAKGPRAAARELES